MARSSYIYVVRAVMDHSILGAFTVKAEAHIGAIRAEVALSSIELVRFPDGRLGQGDVLPWDMKLIEKFTQ